MKDKTLTLVDEAQPVSGFDLRTLLFETNLETN